ncbi:MAG TPA: heavy metal-associated domain-containing protein [Thermoanaerobaculia bacterium]|nr:heavy metal-associated domain-containing protein [Thermoanaerobaculia bacterium]
MTTTILKVDGMNCGNCQRAIVRTLEELPGVSYAAASLPNGQVTIEHDSALSVDADLIHALEGEGYGASRPTAAG